MLTSKNFSDIVTFTRASAGWSYSAGGVLTQAAANVPRLDYDPITLAARGLLLGEQRTNIIRNNSMAGAGPGVSPTFWSIPWTSSNGVSWSFVGTGSENGIPYIDLRLSGTASAQAYLPITIEAPGALTIGQAYTLSGFIRLVAGSLAGGSYGVGEGLRFVESRSSGGPVYNGINLGTITGAPLASQRYSVTKVIDALTTSVIVSFQVPISSGQTIDATFRIGAPQLELGAFATSPILTTNAQVTRAVDSAIITDLSKIGFNPSEGTIVIAGECYNANAVQQGGLSPRMMVLYSSTNSGESLSMYRSSAGNQGSASINTGGAGYPMTGPAIPSGTKFKMAFAYKGGDNALCVNGAAINAHAQMTMPSGIDRMSLGSQGGAAGLWSGWLTLVNYFPLRVANSKLQSLTA